MNTKSKIAYNTLLQLAEKIFVYGLGIINLSLITHHFNTLGYGQYSIANNYINFFALFADWGIGLIVSRDLLKKEGMSERKLFIGNALSFRLFVSIVVYSLALLILPFTHYSPVIIAGVIILTISQFILSFTQIFTSISQVNLNTIGISLGEVIGRVVSLALTIIIVLLDLSLLYTFLTIFISNTILVITTYILIRKDISFTWSINFAVWKEIAYLSIPIGIAGILATVYFKIDALLLSFMKSSVEVGMYSLPYKLLEIMLIIPGIFIGLVMPKLSKEFHENHQEKVAMIINKSLEFMAMIAIPLTFGTMVMAPKLIDFIGGRSFKNYISIVFMNHHIQATPTLSLQILSLAVGISFIDNIFGYYLIAINGQNKSVLRNVIVAIFNIISNILIIPSLTFIGTSVTTVITEALTLAITYYLCMQIYPIHIHIPKLKQILFSTFCMITVIALFYPLHILILLPIAGCIYIAAMYVTKGIEKEELFEIAMIRNAE